MHSLVKGIILSVWIWFIIKVSEKVSGNTKHQIQNEFLYYLAMAFIWRNKHFRVVMCNWCTDYRYRNCNIVFVFRYK